jgi:hypothetical protein
MSILPGPLQIAAIVLSALLPLLLFCYARIGAFRGAGRLFRVGCITIAGFFALACFALPGSRDISEVFGGALLLGTAMLFWYVAWGLLTWGFLTWGFTLTLLTALAKDGHPLTLDQWISAYTQGGNLGTFAHNRLHLLIRSGMVISSDGRIAVTPLGMITARLVRLLRFATGIG